MKNLKKKKGFTLIELIIVISIIVVLAAIAVPKYGKIQKDAKIKADIASAKVIADATVALIAQDKITKATYKDGVNLTKDTNNELTEYLQTAPVVKAVENAVFNVTIDAITESVTVKVGDNELYPIPNPDYSVAPAKTPAETPAETTVTK
ncbi:prepilin-type N-terminal cleavage/methylation domain-containing protein [Clostridium sp.]|uniref:prepilin-type N-terminal cleavage/methylation domain-containing protein n=1 Tax=Clostridium sp. TaxID=1506 RepID=UPI003D6CF580